MASFSYTKVYLNDYITLGGLKEAKGQLKGFDYLAKDYYDGEKTFEKAEVKFQKMALDMLLVNNKFNPNNIDLLIGGDLINQIASTGYNARNYNIPFLGIYSACAIFVEGIIIASNFIEGGLTNKSIVITSSHNLNAEKQFRFPYSYGCPKPERSTFTATGAASVLVSNKKSNIKIKEGTLGKVTDYKITDPYNLGAAMAPSCARVINDHLTDFNRKINYYDLILTGDLGESGSKLLKILLEQEYNLKVSNHLDSGTLIYKKDQNCYDGASGPVVLPFVLFNKIIKSSKYRKILIVGTGAMHNSVMVYQKDSIPSVSYAVSLEVK